MIIQAQLERRKDSRTQRGPSRRKMRLVTSGNTADGRHSQVLIHDLSTNGMLIQTDASLTGGETIGVELPNAGMVQADIVWSSGSYFGCRFVEPVSPAAVSAAVLKASPKSSSAAGDGTALVEFGSRLHDMRRGKNWSLEHLAERLGVSRQAVWYWETGQRLPRPRYLQKLSREFGVPEEEFVAGSSDKTESSRNVLVNQLRQEVARNNGVSANRVRIIVEL